MTLIQLDPDESKGIKREKKLLALILGVVGILTALDVYEDWVDGSPLSHIIPEVLIIFVTVGISLYLLRHALKMREDVLDSVQKEIASAKESAQEWKSMADSLRVGLSEAISAQFAQWGLSPAEQEVSFLLLKGLSIQEIAEVRETTERTVRQQASEVYKKSGLSGRAQLSAFFMEDLFQR
ncbi:MAG: helix-turn-helix transcriptional regulator [Bdellovibrionales bacterium]|nr:helix-turn-helix transcriptional regulator [Bdellovibrionales bacterium]